MVAARSASIRRHTAAHQRAEFFGDEIRIVVHSVGDFQMMVRARA